MPYQRRAPERPHNTKSMPASKLKPITALDTLTLTLRNTVSSLTTSTSSAREDTTSTRPQISQGARKDVPRLPKRQVSDDDLFAARRPLKRRFELTSQVEENNWQRVPVWEAAPMIAAAAAAATTTTTQTDSSTKKSGYPSPPPSPPPPPPPKATTLQKFAKRTEKSRASIDARIEEIRRAEQARKFAACQRAEAERRARKQQWRRASGLESYHC